MARRPSAKTTSSLPVIQTLQWIRKQGFRPVPLLPGKKAAASQSFAKTDYQPPGDDFWKNDNYGIGVVTGPQHDGPIDIDLDCEEALFFAPYFLPPTDAVFGRASKQRSHYLYRLEGSPTFEKKAYNDPTAKSTIVEARGDGHQTAMPGSIHPDTGEVVAWSDKMFPELRPVTADLIMHGVRKIAIATIVVRHIWAQGYHNEPTKHLSGIFFNLEWPVDEACEFIQALMDYSGDNDTSRIPTVRNTYRRGEQGKKLSGAGVLRVQLGSNAKIVDTLLEWAGSPFINLINGYNEHFAVCNYEGKFRVAMTSVIPGDKVVFHGHDDFLNLHANDTIDYEGKTIPCAQVWLKNRRRRTYQKVRFMPGVEDNANTLNLWTGWPIAADKNARCDWWLELMHEVICGGDDEANRWMLNWFANILHDPMVKPLTAPVIVGTQGAGKSLAVSYFGEILGSYYTAVTDERHIYGNFNQHLATTLLLHSEEALFGGEKKHKGIIKSLVTDKTRMTEPKGIDAISVLNFLRLILTSNDIRAAPSEAGDRRFSPIDMGNRKASFALIQNVVKEMQSDGPAGLHHYLLHEFKYDAALARVNLKNDALVALKALNFTPLETWWYETLADGEILPEYAAWASNPKEEPWPTIVSSSALYAVMVIKMKERGVRSIPTETTMAFQLNRFLGETLLKARRTFNNIAMDDWPQSIKILGDRHTAITNLPSLDLCRQAFEKHVGQKLEWPLDDETRPAVKSKKPISEIKY